MAKKCQTKRCYFAERWCFDWRSLDRRYFALIVTHHHIFCTKLRCFWECQITSRFYSRVAQRYIFIQICVCLNKGSISRHSCNNNQNPSKCLLINFLSMFIESVYTSIEPSILARTVLVGNFFLDIRLMCSRYALYALLHNNSDRTFNWMLWQQFIMFSLRTYRNE